MILLNSAYEFRKKCLDSYEYIKNLKNKKTNENILTTTATTAMSDSNLTNDNDNINNDIDLLFNDIMEIVDKQQLQLDNDNSNSNIATNKKYVAESNCKEKYSMKDILQKKVLSTNEKLEIYKCDVCDRHCRSNQGLSQHLKMHEKSLKTISFLCGICDEPFTNINSLKIHKIDAHPTNEDNDSCNNNLILQCYKCLKTFPDTEAFTFHMTRIHKKIDLESKFSCHLCKSKFTHQKLLNNHLQFKHDNESKFYCIYS